MYKAKLQELCQRRRWSLPTYSAMSEGPPHMPNFKASVFVNGVTFSSYHTFHSSKEAYNQAAMNAFLNFSSPPPCTPLLFLSYYSPAKMFSFLSFMWDDNFDDFVFWKWVFCLRSWMFYKELLKIGTYIELEEALFIITIYLKTF